MKTLFKLGIVVLGAFALFTSGCTDDGCTDPLALNYDIDAQEDNGTCEYPMVMLNFDYKVGTEDFSYGPTYTINGVAMEFTLVQFYISKVELEGADANYDYPDNYYLVKPNSGPLELGLAGNTTANTLKFNLGIDSLTNSQSEIDFAGWPADHPLAAQSPSMHWNWNSGYIFIKVEGKVDTDGDGTPDDPMAMHTGTNNLMRVIELNLGDDLNEATKELTLTLDVAKVFDNLGIVNDHVTHTMDNVPLATKVTNNFANAFTY
jgi:hypothetical protein